MEHECVPNRPNGVFCTCGKVVDPEGLRRVRLSGFSGPASLNENVETFWATGDPSVFEQRRP